jgi:hypothetical protein
MRFLKTFVAVAAILAGTAASAESGYRYQNPGQINAATYSFSALADGDLTIYTMNGTGSYLSALGIKVNGQTIASGVLPSGSQIFVPTTFGRVSAGDSIEFFIDTYNRDATNSYIGTYYTDPSHNADGLQHIFASTHTPEPWIGVPEGTFVAFEDTTTGDSLGDANYNDYAFVVPNLTFTSSMAGRPGSGQSDAPVASPAPEPASWAMMLIGFGATGTALRNTRRRVRAVA